MDFMIAVADTVGMIGVALVLVVYLLLNLNRLSPTSMIYLWFNAIGSSFIVFSLFFHWNFPAFFIEAAWVLISLIGIYRVIRTPANA